ncbi:hypothetical protein HPB52_014146 [Rhipicephalus sanguineus]|uniref:Uncharacterized protein n=1 Tax=Rhipicephalus sanguineus TaxID=34632 RepID=A0A9D4PBR4_RHISA|nr:hypothetical protein HPB52_014146 [Rhipicephalus sanguineus]
MQPTPALPHLVVKAMLSRRQDRKKSGAKWARRYIAHRHQEATSVDSPGLILAQALSARPGVATIRVNHKRNVVAADATTRECLEQLLNIKELKGIPVTAKEPADYKSSTGFLQGVDGEPAAESLLPGFKSTVPVLAATREGRTAQCHKNGYLYVDGTRDLTGMMKTDGVHLKKRGSQANDLHVAIYLAVAAAPSSLCKEMWADVVRRSASATMTAMTTMVTEADAAHGYPPLPITAGASTSASTGTVDAQVKLHPVHAPALVGGVWIHRKVTKTGRAAVPLPAAAFELGPASDCGPPDACGVTSKVIHRAATQPTPALPHLVVKAMLSRRQDRQNCHTATFVQAGEICR